MKSRAIRVSDENYEELRAIAGKYGTINAAVDLLLRVREEHLSEKEEART
jgi:hypothetical protein